MTEEEQEAYKSSSPLDPNFMPPQIGDDFGPVHHCHLRLIRATNPEVPEAQSLHGGELACEVEGLGIVELNPIVEVEHCVELAVPRNHEVDGGTPRLSLRESLLFRHLSMKEMNQGPGFRQYH